MAAGLARSQGYNITQMHLARLKTACPGHWVGHRTNQLPLRKYWQELQAWFLYVTLRKTTMSATNMVSIDATIASVLSEMESISSLKEEQRTSLKAFLDGKDVLTLLPNDFSKSLIYQAVIRFVDLAGRSQLGWTITERWFIQTPAKYFFKVPVLSQTGSNGALPDGCV